jgi:hypothetical protein
VALSWQPDGRLHVTVLDVAGHPIFVHTPGGQQILIGGSDSPSALLAAVGQQLPFWDHDLDLIIASQTTTSQLNGLLGVLERYQVRGVATVEASTGSRAGRDWNDALSRHSLEPVLITDTQAIEIEPDVLFRFDGSGVSIESGGTVISVGPSPLAQIDFIDGPVGVLPLNAQLIFAWDRSDDPRVITLPEHGSIDVTLDSAGIVISVLQ